MPTICHLEMRGQVGSRTVSWVESGEGSPPTQPVKASTVPRSETRKDRCGASVCLGYEACESFPLTGLATLPLPLGSRVMWTLTYCYDSGPQGGPTHCKVQKGFTFSVAQISLQSRFPREKVRTKR